MSDDLLSRIGQVAGQQNAGAPSADLSSRIADVASGKAAQPIEQPSQSHTVSQEQIDAMKKANPPMRQLKEGAIGFAKSAGQTAATVLDYMSGGPSAIALHSAGIESPNRQKLDDALTLKNDNERGGAMVEGVAEFMLGDEALKGLSLAERAGLLAKVAKLGESHPVLAKIVKTGIDSMRQGTVGTVQGLAHGEDPGTAAKQGAVIGAGSALLQGATQALPAVVNAGVEGAQGAAGAAKKAVNLFRENAAQPELQAGVRKSASEAATQATGLKTNFKAGSIRDTFSSASDAVMQKSKSLFAQVDDATNGSFQTNQNALQKLKLDMRMAESDEALDNLRVKKTALESEQEEIFAAAKEAGVDENTVNKARATYRQASALDDVDSQLKMSTGGMRPGMGEAGKQSPEVVDPKKLFGRLNKLYDSGRLQEAVGEQNAQKLLKAADDAQISKAKAVTYKAWAKRIATFAGLGTSAEVAKAIFFGE